MSVPMVRLTDILDQEQMTTVSRIVADIKAGRSQARELRSYLKTQQESLAEKEIDSGYLYYAICYAVKLPV